MIGRVVLLDLARIIDANHAYNPVFLFVIMKCSLLQVVSKTSRMRSDRVVLTITHCSLVIRVRTWHEMQISQRKRSWVIMLNEQIHVRHCDAYEQQSQDEAHGDK